MNERKSYLKEKFKHNYEEMADEEKMEHYLLVSKEFRRIQMVSIIMSVCAIIISIFKLKGLI
jgi:hypothetical protein